MNRLFVLFMLALAACNDAPPAEQKENSDSPGVSAMADTSKATVDTTATAITATNDQQGPYALTPEEMKDDSVFKSGDIPSSWENAGITNPLALKRFVKQLKYWVANDMKDSVAGVMLYPMRNPQVKNRERFIDAYDNYISARVKRSLKDQSLSQLFRNQAGVSIGQGELWITETPQGYRIVAINN